VIALAVVLMMEWDKPKEETRLREYRKTGPRTMHVQDPWWQKKVKEGIVKRAEGWADVTGHIIGWIEFENMDTFGKFWSDKEWHMLTIGFQPLVDNLHMRLLRPSVRIKEE